MSLDTVLKIGKAFRAADNGLKHFRFVRPCPKDEYDNKGNLKSKILRLSLPIKEDYSFDFENIEEITDENIIGSETKDTKLFYLTFKTSGSDGLVKYVFGDIFYSVSSASKNGKIERNESGFYRLDNPIAAAAYKKNSYDRGKDDFSGIVELSKKSSLIAPIDILEKFSAEFNKNKQQIHNILKYHVGLEETIQEKKGIPPNFFNENEKMKEIAAKKILEKLEKSKNGKKEISNILGERQSYNWDDVKSNEENINKLSEYCNSSVFIHFKFPEKDKSNEHWYSYKDDIKLINLKMFDDFVEPSNIDNCYVFKKTLYNTLCSGNLKNDIQFPEFLLAGKYKSKIFNIDEINDLFFAIDYSKKATLFLSEDIKLIVLPFGNDLKANDYESFSKTSNELVIDRSNTGSDSLFSWFDIQDDHENKVTQFDLIFCKIGGKNPDVNLIEISGIKKSHLQQIKKRIEDIQKQIYEKRQSELLIQKELEPISINWSFTKILGNLFTDEKTGKLIFKPSPKYQSHLLKVLPQIYTATYTNDEMLLPAFIDIVEYSIRQGDPKFVFLKYDLEFLLSIQNTQQPKENFMRIIESPSYQLGIILGRLARQFSGEDSPIKSFEKNYCGNLTRRIPTLKDFIILKNEIEEKLIMHDRVKYTFKESNQLADLVNEFEEIFDKNECAYGFFDSYFERLSKKSLSEKIEKLLDDEKEVELNKNLIANIKNVLINNKKGG
ncbi:MAG: hypothetical protein NT007_00935 [Candidatus Kapabacteria bacterium]|nr:hypothetical protein [Candidatus Kapabacteria bacterium]